MSDELERRIEEALDIMTVGEVAQLLRRAHSTIGNAIRTGKLIAYKAGGEYIITKTALKEFLGIPDD